MNKVAKTRNEIALEYGVCTKTLKKWLNDSAIDIPNGLITPKQHGVIYEKFGIPKLSENSRKIPEGFN
jgi:hypothetical protein